MKLRRLFVAAMTALLLLPITSTYAEEPFPEVESQYIYIYDIDTQQVLQDINSDTRIYPASITKIMTAMVALNKEEDLQKTVTITQDMLNGLVEANASVVGYYVGQTPTILDLLYGVILPSGADACNALAAATYGSTEAFVEVMNDTAQSIGMENTHFTNTTGLHEDDHYSTSKDLAILTEYALQNDLFREIFATKTYTDSVGNYMYATIVPYIEWEYIYLPGFIGDKTGFTYEAGHCMASYASLNDMNLVIITAGAMTGMYSPDHLYDTSKILSWLEQNYERKQVIKKGDSLATYTAKRVIGESTQEILAESDLYLDVLKDVDITVMTDIEETYTVTNDEQNKELNVSILQNDAEVITISQEFTIPKASDFMNKVLIFFRDLF